jgi:hypothetical protein
MKKKSLAQQDKEMMNHWNKNMLKKSPSEEQDYYSVRSAGKVKARAVDGYERVYVRPV